MSNNNTNVREKLWSVIFETDTSVSKAFDLALLIMIAVSVTLVMLESVPSVRETYGTTLLVAEWIITGLFTIEYLVRISIVRNRRAYMTSFFGIVDLLAILPTYISLIVPGAQSLTTIRSLRLLRIFRVLKLVRFMGQANVLRTALRSSGHKVVVFLGTVFVLVVILGSIMYLIEGETDGFTSIPDSVYWAIVTVTTVGYGDIVPTTPLGKALGAIAMVIGYSIIAVPTGIVSSEMIKSNRALRTRTCPKCLSLGHDDGARYCKNCSAPLSS